MHIRVKVPQELHAALKIEAAARGVTLEKLCVERLSQERGVMPIEPYMGTNKIAVTGGSPSGNETAGTIKESLHVQSPNQNGAEFLKQEDRLISSVISNINNEKLQRIAEGWNMDSRDCSECGVESGKKHLRTCVRGVRIASEAQEKMNVQG